MRFLDALEKRLGRYAVPNVTLWLVASQAFVYVADTAARANGQVGIAGQLLLVPALVVQGEVWRLVTFPFVPPPIHPIVALIYLSAFYFFGRAVESVWGAFRYNAYLLVGFVLTAGVSFLTPFAVTDGAEVKTSVFLAFATLFPEYVIRLYAILPIRAKFLAAFTWALYAYWCYVGDVGDRLSIAAAVGNYFFFFAGTAWQGVKQRQRRRAFQRRAQAGAKPLIHECRVCGLTSQMDPKMTFRYCSKCSGQQCYCAEHIRDHECV